jgi:hypothetical protein
VDISQLDELKQLEEWFEFSYTKHVLIPRLIQGGFLTVNQIRKPYDYKAAANLIMIAKKKEDEHWKDYLNKSNKEMKNLKEDQKKYGQNNKGGGALAVQQAIEKHGKDKGKVAAEMKSIKQVLEEHDWLKESYEEFIKHFGQ